MGKIQCSANMNGVWLRVIDSTYSWYIVCHSIRT